ncbi:sensor histidine kinase [Thalassotalea euphylliae]|nr:HAMP domain-containing sensor histidine kinase [Thalassotalea euphylliae]
MFTQIRSQIMAYCIGLVLFISLLFGALSFLFTYYVEDSLFSRLLEQEKLLVAQQIDSGEAVNPQLNFVRYYPSIEQLPSAISEVLKVEPERIEFTGRNQQHYHLVTLANGTQANGTQANGTQANGTQANGTQANGTQANRVQAKGFLVAEVSELLIVRNIKGGIAKTQGVFIAIVIAFTLWLAWSLAKRIIRPIEQLNQVLVQVKGDELPTGFAKQFKQDEIGLFAQQLELAIARVRSFIAREQHFTRDVSHELRTPIAISQGAVTVLKDTPLSDEQTAIIERIAKAQQQMQLCIESLLMLAREGELAHEASRVLPLVESTVVEHHQLIDNKPIELMINIPSDATIQTHPQAFRIVLSNLISNAFQHTQQGEITIDWHDFKLRISDGGEGINEALLPKVFETGTKGEQSQGFGIGLSLVKRLCDHLGINIHIESSALGTAISLGFKQG